MYRKILVPLDGSPLSAGILPYVRWLAHGLKVPPTVWHPTRRQCSGVTIWKRSLCLFPESPT